MTDQPAPYSQEAEEAVLGAVIVNPNAFLTIASFLTKDEFFFVRNGYIWEGLSRLHDRKESVDYVTLAKELQDMGHLEMIGGPAYLTQLINAAPSSQNAEIYGRLVERSAIRRKLIIAADEIKDLARNEEMTIESVTAEVENRLFTVTDKQVKREFVSMSEAVSEYFDRIEYLMDHQNESFGVPSGFRDLDALFGGFQRSDLMIFAARPGMGKTSFLITTAVNVARLGGRVAIFTMEMGVDQFVQRMISMETGISSQQLRLGKLSPREYSRFVEAAGRVSNFPIFIDDTPALNPMQMRTKCRRLMHEHGIDLILVDYLQLMNSGGFYQNNRVQEVSFISRSLKELARELNVPMISAAQLSRAVEQRQDKRPVLSDLRESGCLAEESLVYLPDEGKYTPIKDLVGKKGFNVLSLNTDTWELESDQVTNAFCTGTKPVYRLTTALGRTIRATGNHKFLTISGWQRLDKLSPKERIAVPRQIEAVGKQTMSNDELALLGHLIGDGCVLPRHSIQYTTVELDLAELVSNLATSIFEDELKPRVQKETNQHWYQVFMPTTRHITHGVRNPISEWFEELGIFGLRSFEKFIPKKVFQQTKESIATFLRHLWATDGSIGIKKTSNRNYPNVYYASSSEQLARDVQSLLLRLGINARLSRIGQGNKGRDQFHISVTGIPDLQKYIQYIGAVGEYKLSRLSDVKDYVSNHIANTNRDVIPREIWRQYAVPAMQAIGMTTRQMQAKLGNNYCGTGLYKQNVSRDRAIRLAEVVQSQTLTQLAQSDIYWDKIVSIEPDGETEVYDLTVSNNSNFICQDIQVHNSLEQDADIVMFLYRDSVYNEASEFPNQADIIVAKHRNGPTDTISLYFDNTITKFMDGVTRKVDLGEY